MKRLIIGLILLATSQAGAATIHVPADQPTIQAGIDAAVDGDTVLVAPGNYKGVGNKDLVISYKELTVMSQSGAYYTIIDCEGTGRGFDLVGSPEQQPLVQGFTVKNGMPGNAGGAIQVFGCSPTIQACVLTGNNANYGGAAYVNGNESKLKESPTSTFLNCTFVGNTANNCCSVIYAQNNGVIVIRAHVKSCVNLVFKQRAFRSDCSSFS